MSERTTIGGTVYEAVGSSSSNLLLKCNGTARIQWGNKLIDLIKNGKIASGDSSTPIFEISDRSEIKSDGIYILNSNESSQLIIQKNSKSYDFTDTELYISASNEQDLTVEQQQQAMENIGMYYDTLEDVEKAGIQNGIVYVYEDKSLYTIKDGSISEFEAKLKTVSVEKESEDGERINSSVQVVLSVLDTDYIVLKDKLINIKQTISVSPYSNIQSERASNTSGYRLYMKDGQSYLEIDNLIWRNQKEESDFIEVSVAELRSLIQSSELKPSKWYVITNYCNPWKLFSTSPKSRPLYFQALESNKLSSEGVLYEDKTVTVKYDPFFNDSVYNSAARGLITWMRDSNGNEANFDFLDWDSSEVPNTIIHSVLSDSGDYYQVLGYSIFPRNSKNNKLTITNFNQVFSGETINFPVSFGILDSSGLEGLLQIAKTDVDSLPVMEMRDNVIECYGVTTSEECLKFYDNSIKKSGILKFNSSCRGNTLCDIYNTSENTTTDDLSTVTLTETVFTKEISDVTINSCSNSIINESLIRNTFDRIILSTINGSITNSSFRDMSNCTINATCNKVTFNTLNTCTIGEGNLENLTCRSDLASISIDSVTYPLLYDTTKIKDVYYINGEFRIVDSAASGFPHGTIVMYSGKSIPDGWAPCDGKEHPYQGNTYRTPNLVGRFIKATNNFDDIGEVNVRNDGANNDFKLTEAHLPQHSHPHEAHTHEISNISGTLEESGDLTFTLPTYISGIGASTSSGTINEGESAIITDVNYEEGSETITGGNHTHNLTISGGSITNVVSTESEKTWENQSFSIEPNYYSLIFIMKL